MDGVKMCSRSSNLGDSRTIVTQPSISTHNKLSVEDRLAVEITDGLVRISVGLEHPDDIIQDLTQALDSLK
jgi:O-succinylhomoserine sulfhydrylase